MTSEQWVALASVVVSLSITVGSWMFKVHAKLAVIASQFATLCEKLETADAEQRQLWEMAARHRSRLDTHDVQIEHLADRLREAVS